MQNQSEDARDATAAFMNPPPATARAEISAEDAAALATIVALAGRVIEDHVPGIRRREWPEIFNSAVRHINQAPHEGLTCVHYVQKLTAPRQPEADQVAELTVKLHELSADFTRLMAVVVQLTQAAASCSDTQAKRTQSMVGLMTRFNQVLDILGMTQKIVQDLQADLAQREPCLRCGWKRRVRAWPLWFKWVPCPVCVSA